MQMAEEYELVCVQQTCGSPEKIGEIASGNGARRVGFRESDDDWFAWGDECKRIADEGCEALIGQGGGMPAVQGWEVIRAKWTKLQVAGSR